MNPVTPNHRPAATWPTLELDQWRDSYATLHMWAQIVGKTRLALAPMENHWWQVAFYLTPRGLTTSAMPAGERTFAVDFDFIDHGLHLRVSDGATATLRLAPRSVADFHAAYQDVLRSLDIDVRIRPVPVEVTTAIPFAEDHEHASYDPDAAHRCWRVMVNTDRVLKRYRGRFQGKASPVHFFWGAFDLCTTRFSGRRAPPHRGGVPNCPDYVMEEGYSHECSSCGFWPGGGAVDEPAFYAYAYPEPAGYSEGKPGPEGAYYHPELREFILPYEVVRTSASPDDTLMRFLEGTYGLAADLGQWDRAALDRRRGNGPTDAR
ncbi:MAG: DUF5996 family protein [Gemmatimonadaceae bacterium]